MPRWFLTYRAPAWTPALLLLVGRWMVFLVALPSVLPAQEWAVVISEPPPGVPLFGEIRIGAEAFGDDVVRMEFLVDGTVVAERPAPPWEARFDVGQENRIHRIEVRAHNAAGEVASALLISPAIQVDAQIEAALQQLYVTVSNQERRVLDLSQDDFTVLDNETAQALVTFARGDVRLTAVLLVDASRSMKGSRLRFALRGASAFVSNLVEHDNASILVFSDQLLHATAFSNDPRALTAGLEKVAAAGGTALHDHMYLALKRLEREQGRRVLVLLSDGVDTHSTLRIEEVRWLARRSQALIYWIRTSDHDPERSRYSAWKGPRRYRSEHDILTQMVADSGGRIVTLDRIALADQACQAILQELREQYVLGYYPSDAWDDGRWHKVRVRVRRPELAVRAPAGYIDYPDPPLRRH